MARKTKILSIPSTGDKTSRDAGKHFLITEKPAVQAEKWAARALMAAANAGIDIPPEVIKMGAGAALAIGLRALLSMSFADAEPLLDEMLQCVEIVPDPKRPEVVRSLDEEDVEEVATLLLLRSEVIEIHTGFSIAAFLSNLGKAASSTEPAADPLSSNTPTSPSPSEQS